MSTWEAVDETGRVRRFEYRFGEGSANALAIDTGGGGLVLISPPAGRDGQAGRTALDRLGAVTAIVAPNAFHRAGIAAAEAAYPMATIHADPRAIKRVAKVCKDPTRVRPLQELADRLPEGVEIFVPPFLKRPDTIVRVATAAGTVWCFNDIIINIEKMPRGLLRWVLRVLGFRQGLMVNPVGGRLILVGDRRGLSKWLCAELERLPPVALVTGHGPAIRDPAALRGLPGLVARGLS